MLQLAWEYLRVYDYFHLGIGIVTVYVNAVTAHLTFFHSGAFSKNYRYYLLALQISLFFGDVFNSFIASCVMLFPVPCGYCNGLFYGVLSDLTGLGQREIITFLIFSLQLNAFFYGWCFLFRHQAVQKPSSRFKFSQKQQWILMGSLEVFLLGMPFFIFIGTIPNQEAKEEIHRHFRTWVVSLRERITCMEFRSSEIFIVYVLFTLLLSTVFLGLTCGHIFYTLKRTLAISSRNVKYHAKMTQLLIFQVTIPTIFSTLPLSVIMIQSAHGIESHLLSLINAQALWMHSLAHCVVLIGTTRSYRLVLLRAAQKFSFLPSVPTSTS